MAVMGIDIGGSGIKGVPVILETGELWANAIACPRQKKPNRMMWPKRSQ